MNGQVLQNDQERAAPATINNSLNTSRRRDGKRPLEIIKIVSDYGNDRPSVVPIFRDWMKKYKSEYTVSLSLAFKTLIDDEYTISGIEAMTLHDWPTLGIQRGVGVRIKLAIPYFQGWYDDKDNVLHHRNKRQNRRT